MEPTFTQTVTRIKKINVFSDDSLITNISSIASGIEYIQLQTSDTTPIKAIDKIVVLGNRIYINLINNLICFDNHGTFLYKLYGDELKREENRVAIYDFDICSVDSSLVVLYGNKIIHFANTGSEFKYLDTIELGRMSPSKLDFVPGTNKILLSSTRIKGNESALHVLINLKGDTLSFKPVHFNGFNPVKNRVWDEIIHFQFDDKLKFRERLNDTIFSVDANSNHFSASLILDSRLSGTNPENINDPEYFKILPNVVKIFESSRYLYYVYIFNKCEHQVFYDKVEDRKYEVHPDNGALKDDLSGGPDFKPMFCYEGNLYSWISPKGNIQYNTNNPILIKVSMK